MKQHERKNFLIILLVILISLAVITGFFMVFNKPNQELFKASGKDWNSPKKVEDYFVERLHMPPEEAKTIRSTEKGNDGKVNLRISTDTTLQGLTGNLSYYGFVRDEKVLLYALEHTQDTTPYEKAIVVGKNGTIDQNAEYRISEDMSAWEIADILLNKPSGHFPFDEYNYFFMP